MKIRRHHNNSGYRTIKRGKTRTQLRQIALKLGLPFAENGAPPPGEVILRREMVGGG